MQEKNNFYSDNNDGVGGEEAALRRFPHYLKEKYGKFKSDIKIDILNVYDKKVEVKSDFHVFGKKWGGYIDYHSPNLYFDHHNDNGTLGDPWKGVINGIDELLFQFLPIHNGIIDTSYYDLVDNRNVYLFSMVALKEGIDKYIKDSNLQPFRKETVENGRIIYYTYGYPIPISVVYHLNQSNILVPIKRRIQVV